MTASRYGGGEGLVWSVGEHSQRQSRESRVDITLSWAMWERGPKCSSPEAKGAKGVGNQNVCII